MNQAGTVAFPKEVKRLWAGIGNEVRSIEPMFNVT
jgi:hypothetical protein